MKLKSVAVLIINTLGIISCNGGGVSNNASSGNKSSLTTKIIGGTDVPEGKYPFMITLGNPQLPFAIGTTCGGVLIGTKWVLTARHCVEDEFKKNSYSGKIMLSIGTTKLDGKINRIAYANAIVFPEATLTYPFFGGDIALIQLDREINDVTPIRLPILPQLGDTLSVIGFGYTAESEFSQTLKETSNRIIPANLCVTESINVNTEICAGYENSTDYQGAADGDSGGPLFKKIDNNYYLAGIVNRGDREYQKNATIYANVAYWENWVRDMQQMEVMTDFPNDGVIYPGERFYFTFNSKRERTQRISAILNDNPNIKILPTTCVLSMMNGYSCSFIMDINPNTTKESTDNQLKFTIESQSYNYLFDLNSQRVVTLTDHAYNGADIARIGESVICNIDRNLGNRSEYENVNFVPLLYKDGTNTSSIPIEKNKKYYRLFNSSQLTSLINATPDDKTVFGIFNATQQNSVSIGALSYTIWTGASGKTCNNWSSSLASGYTGASDGIGLEAYSNFPSLCYQKARLYCVSEPLKWDTPFGLVKYNRKYVTIAHNFPQDRVLQRGQNYTITAKLANKLYSTPEYQVVADTSSFPSGITVTPHNCILTNAQDSCNFTLHINNTPPTIIPNHLSLNIEKFGQIIRTQHIGFNIK